MNGGGCVDDAGEVALGDGRGQELFGVVAFGFQFGQAGRQGRPRRRRGHPVGHALTLGVGQVAAPAGRRMVGFEVLPDGEQGGQAGGVVDRLAEGLQGGEVLGVVFRFEDRGQDRDRIAGLLVVVAVVRVADRVDVGHVGVRPPGQGHVDAVGGVGLRDQ